MAIEPSDDPLVVQTHGLAGAHASIAIEALCEAYSAVANTSDPGGLIRCHNRSISAIIHGCCALEAALNHHAYHVFSDPKSHLYVQPKDRSVAVDFVSRAWHRSLTSVEKLRFLADRVELQLSARLQAELQEVATLRNWLVHGFVYTVTLLVSPLEPVRSDSTVRVFDVHDREDSVDWQTRFPHLSFNALDRLDHSDATKSFRVSIEALRLLVASGALPVPITQRQGGKWFLHVIDATTDAHEFFQKAIGTDIGP